MAGCVSDSFRIARTKHFDLPDVETSDGCASAEAVGVTDWVEAGVGERAGDAAPLSEVGRASNRVVEVDLASSGLADGS